MNFKPRKRLGQNFLIDKNIQNKIIKYCDLKKDDLVLEIGAGRGELTQKIAKQTQAVIALELDSNLCAILRENLSNFKNVKINQIDILKFKIKDLKFKKKIKVIGNLPYYLTTPIIARVLNERNFVDKMYITVQKEVARRFVAGPNSKDYGAFSCFLNYYTEPTILFFIKNSSFWPMPKIDSAFMRLNIRKKAPVFIKDEELFFRIIRKGFSCRRKMLKNNLKHIFSEEKLFSAFNLLDLETNVRAEDLSLEKFAQLINLLN